MNTNAAAAAAPKAERSRLEPAPMPRRDFLGLSAIGAALGALLFATLGALKLPKPGVLPSPSKKFRVALPESLAPGDAFLPPGRPVAIFRDAAGVFAVSRICTHLGCIIQPSATGFDCPCHGSKFTAGGTVIGGPAPKALPWLAVKHLGGNNFVIDEGTPVPAGTKVTA